MTDDEKTAALREAGKLLAKQALDNLAYAAASYAKDPFKIDKRSIVADLRSGLDRLEHAHDMMGVAPAAPKPALIVEHTESLTHRTLDVHGNAAPRHRIGTSWKHSGNGKTYYVNDTTWLGETDEWGVSMYEIDHRDPVIVTRPEHHLEGMRNNGRPRYEIIA